MRPFRLISRQAVRNLAGMALALPLTAGAVTWEPLRDFPFSSEIDKDLLLKQGSKTFVWLLITYRKPQNNTGVRGDEILSRRQYVQIECDRNTLGTVQIVDYAQPRGEGRLVFQSEAYAFPRMDPAIPGTLEEAAVTNICNRVKPLAQPAQVQAGQGG
ncbi:MAG: hypothetical protein MO853_01585 [Candidatus Protistobacter heckmanni]|nr:hypothetical protein [Candidatus Protistobacter heckmanni]